MAFITLQVSAQDQPTDKNPSLKAPKDITRTEIIELKSNAMVPTMELSEAQQKKFYALQRNKVKSDQDKRGDHLNTIKKAKRKGISKQKDK